MLLAHVGKKCRAFHERIDSCFNGEQWDVPGGHVRNGIICNNVFGSSADVKKSYCGSQMKRNLARIQSAWEEMIDW